MAGSQDPKTYRRSDVSGKAAARTPGTLGRNDHADPDVHSHKGDSPGTLGAHDHASEVADAEESAALNRKKSVKLMLLNKNSVAAFLYSVIYNQLTADMIKLQTERVGLVFKTTTVDTGDEQQKDKRLKELLPEYMKDFAEASSHGGKAAVEFLLDAEHARDMAQERIREISMRANEASEQTTKNIGTTVKGLKTVEYGAGAALTVMGLFVGAAGALAAGIIGFSYDTMTDVIDGYREKGRVDADVVALVSEDTAKNTGVAIAKEVAKGKLAGQELENVEKLEEAVRDLKGKIAVKKAMIAESKSVRNSNKIGRALTKDELALGTAERSITRFKGVNVLFAVWDLSDKGRKIYKAWNEPE